MDNEQTEVLNTLPGKKVMHQQLADKLASALPELKEMLGEKKFGKRTEKAAKLLLKGLHKEDLVKQKAPTVAKANTTRKPRVKKASTETDMVPVAKKRGRKPNAEKAAAKKAATAKVSAKKAAVKKATAKMPKKASAKKLKKAR